MICGLIILRHLAAHLKLRLLIKTSSIKSVIAFVSHFLTDLSGVLSEPLEYKEIVQVCSTLKLGVSGVEIDYEHIRFAGPPFWKLLFQLYQAFSIISLFAIPYQQALFCHFSKVKVLKLIIKTTIGVLLYSLLSAKFTRWSSSIIWKNLQNSRTLFKYAIRLERSGWL